MVQQPHNHSDGASANGGRGVHMEDTDATALINAIVDPVLEVGRDGRVRFPAVTLSFDAISAIVLIRYCDQFILKFFACAMIAL